MERFVHLLSKEARKRLIEILLERRGLRETSALLGVTPASISKYRYGAMHPSDETLARALKAMEEEELGEAARVIFYDLYSGFLEFIEWAVQKGVLEREMAERLDSLSSRVSASLPKRGRITIR
ncbi:MAG: transcriptional regulator [Acidilobaceae archaeon]|nr:transcriptional regulator [Acidilobaceae archaeon]